MGPSVWNHRIRRLAWLPIPILLFVIVVFWAAGLSAVYEPPHLALTLSVFFMLPVALLVAYQVGRSFLLRENRGLLWLGCGMLFWGSAGPLGGALLSQDTNVAVTVYTLLLWLAAVCHGVGVFFASWQRKVHRWPELWLAGAYVGVLALVVVVVLATRAGVVPVFFIQGEGGTPLRQIVLGSAIALLVLAAVALKGEHRETPSLFEYGYALGLLLIAVGLFGVMIQSFVGSALGWISRIAQYLGGVYLMVATAIGMREARDWSRSLEAALGDARQRFEELFNLASDGIVVHEQMSKTTLGHFLQVNPAFCTLLGYTPQELRDLTPLDLITPEDRPQTVADIQRLDHGLSRYEKTLVAKDGRRIPVEINSRQYPHQGRTMVISVIRDITERKRAEEALRENEQLKQAVLDAMSAHIVVLDREGCMITTNTSWRRFAVENNGGGNQPAPNTDVGVNYLDICRTARGECSEGAMEAHDGIQAVLEDRAESFSQEYACHAPGKQRWFSMVVTALRGRRGRAVVSHTDITVHRELTEKLCSQRDYFTQIAATVPGAICSFRLGPDGSACFPYATPAIEDLYGLRPEVLAESAAPLWAMIHPDDLGPLDAGITASAQAMTPWRDEFRVRHPIKGEIWVEGHSMPVREPDGSTVWNGYVQDITDRKRLEEDLRRLATTDPLTGAFNRRYLLQVMEKEISRAQRYARPVSLIMFDLDHFKRINDQLGHDQGDAVLKGVAVMGRERLRHSDIFVRWGGEEFMILAPETAMPQAVALAETLRAGFRQLSIADIGTITASFGVTQYRPDETLDQWLKRVDDLVYQVKREGRDHISYRPSERPVR